MVTLTINGKAHIVNVLADMPLLWALRDVIGLTGTKLHYRAGVIVRFRYSTGP